MKLQDAQIEEKLASLEGWVREDERWISKKYRFRDYMDGIAFVQRVAAASEAMNHHPLISIDYKLVTLRLTSWRAGGLTELDFTAAAAYDETFGTKE